MDFKELKEKIKQAKSKDELSKNWSSFVEELKKSKKVSQATKDASLPAPAPPAKAAAPSESAPAAPSSAIKEVAGEPLKPFWSKETPQAPLPPPAASGIHEARVKELEAKVADLESRQKAHVEQMRAKVMENETLRAKAADSEEFQSQMKQQQAKIETFQTQMARLRQDLALRMGEIEAFRQSHAAADDIEKERAALEQAKAAVQAEREESLRKIEDLLGRLEEKDRQIEQLRYQVTRFENGDLNRAVQTKLSESAAAISQLQAQLQAKAKELEEARFHWDGREREAAARREEDIKESAAAHQSLEHDLRRERARVSELESQASSLSRLLHKEEERSRRLEEENQIFERDRRLISERLALLGDEVKGQQAKLMRYLEPAPIAGGAQGSEAPRSVAPAPQEMPGVVWPAEWGFGLADDPGLIFDWEDPSLSAYSPNPEPGSWEDPLTGDFSGDDESSLGM
ncbi:MAG: hypothetical protein HY547_07850 [Elusimicrobia bacterium]|nr:hypothetical protein [Elusimicrobiota bacterium]